MFLFYFSKFWTRNRPGDSLRDKYNLNTLPIGPDGEVIDGKLIYHNAIKALCTYFFSNLYPLLKKNLNADLLASSN